VYGFQLEDAARPFLPQIRRQIFHRCGRAKQTKTEHLLFEAYANSRLGFIAVSESDGANNEIPPTEEETLKIGVKCLQQRSGRVRRSEPALCVLQKLAGGALAVVDQSLSPPIFQP
jgi:hypothetical protein